MPLARMIGYNILANKESLGKCYVKMQLFVENGSKNLLNDTTLK